MHVLSIQSSVAFGHVGNSSAAFALQRMGVEVSAVNTVHFSNHAGYGRWRGPVMTADDLTDVLDGMDELGVLGSVDAVLSGYLGEASTSAVVVDAVARVRAANPDAVYCCDPVMGDTGSGIYVRRGIPEFMRDQAVGLADVLTPNHYELEYLVGRRVRTLDDALAAAAEVRAHGPRVVLVTSLLRADAATDEVELLATTDDDAYAVATPLLPLDVDGCGDMATALFLAHWLHTKDLSGSVAATANVVYRVLEETHRAGAQEIQLVAAQQAIGDPPTRFTAVPARRGRAGRL